MDQIEQLLDQLKEKLKLLHEVYMKLSHTEATFHMPGHHIKHFIKLRTQPSAPSESKSLLDSILDGFHLHSKVSSTQEMSIEIGHIGVSHDHGSCSNTSSKEDNEITPDFPSISKEPHEVTIIDTLLDTLHLKPPDSPTPVEEQVMKFHQQADEVQKILRSIQRIVLCKYSQKPIRRNIHGKNDLSHI